MPICNCHGGEHCCMKMIPGNAGNPLFEDPGEDIQEPVEPLSDETIKALAEAGIVLSEWQPEIVTEGDAVQILAFHKFLCGGEWVQTEERESLFQVDQASFDYATGKITAKEYLDG